MNVVEPAKDGAAEWLAARRPSAPAGLAARLQAIVEQYGGDPDGAPFERCLLAAERVLGDLLRQGCASRESALDLLAADALVTYAFEAAAESPESLDARAGEAMARIAALGAPAAGERGPCGG